MRYPEGNRRSNSISLSGDRSGGGGGGSGFGSRDQRHHLHPIRFPSSSTGSQDSHYQEDAADNDLHLPGSTAAPDDNDNSTGSSSGGVGRANIETISEHVLFGNNNGNNSFLYLYYSTQRNSLQNNTSDHILRRPYTTGGGGGVGSGGGGFDGGFNFKGRKIMGSSQKPQGDDPLYKSQWNDFPVERDREEEVPPSIFTNDNEDYFGEGDVGSKNDVNGNSKSSGDGEDGSRIRNDNETMPYPVYLSPVEGSPIRIPSLSPKQMSFGEDGSTEETRSSSMLTSTRRDRLDSFGADLLEDDWDKIYSVPDVDARYIMSPERSGGAKDVGTKRKQSESDSGPMDKTSSSTDHNDPHPHHHKHHSHNQHHHHKKQPVKEQHSTTSSNNLSVSKLSRQSSAKSINRTRQGGGSIKRVRVVPNEGGKGAGGIKRGNSMKQWSSTSSMKSPNKLSPLSSNPGSRSPSTRSLKRATPHQHQHHHHHHHNHHPHQHHHGVTHHHHKPLNGVEINCNSDDDDDDHENGGKPRISSTTTQDGFDQMSFNFQNGIGAFFGTPASRQIAHKNEPTPEEMFKQEMLGWRPRLALGATIFTATLLILSCASLLFVFPIFVDPILVGIEAQFSREPVTCRTTNFRNGTGPSECATPSCREGCTLDLFSCIFIDVEYYNVMNDNLLLEPRNDTSTPVPQINNVTSSATTTTTTAAPTTSMKGSSNLTTAKNINEHSEIGHKRSAILYVNINGCGYPPSVKCSDFQHKYAKLNTQFPCYYSHQNGSIVVPEYSRHTQIIYLTLAVCIPFSIILVSSISLYFLVKYHKYLKLSIRKKFSERKKALRAKLRAEWENEMKEMNGETNENEAADATSITELEPTTEEYNYRKNIKAMQNGASKTGTDSRNQNSTTM